MSPQKTESSTCFMLPEMVDVGVAEMAAEKDLRAAVAEARRVAELLRGQDPARETALPQAPGWPMESGSLAEAVYWYRHLSGQGKHTRPEDIIVALDNLGYSWRIDRRWAEAEAAFRESMQLSQQHGDRAGVGQTFLNLAFLYQEQERWADAESALAQGLEIVREIGNRRDEANALGHLAVVSTAQGQAEKASTYLQQAVAIAHELGDEGLAKRLRERLARMSHG